jgi:formylglycine-generating enzyme required for sulfatase activity/serine/threonine protein kinase
VRPLGKGSFGEVWEALGPGGFPVATKFVYLAGKVSNAELRSLELIKNLRHPNLLALHGAWERGNLLILAMELADGTLLDRLRQAVEGEHLPGIPLPELLRQMGDAARGLDYLNAHGVQHRDVKPHNLMLVGGGVKVGDFGLAKLLQQTLATASGSMTPAYASPEACSDQVSRWSDQYSLGVTYCQLRGNRVPFEGGTLAAMITGHLMNPPNLEMIPGAEEQQVVARALAKKPEERWPDCAAFVAALASCGMASTDRVAPPLPVGDDPAATERGTPVVEATVPGTVTPRAKSASRRPLWLMVACGIALLASVLLAIALLQPGHHEESSPPALTWKPVEDVTLQPGEQRTIPLQVDRQSSAGPVRFELLDKPAEALRLDLRPDPAKESSARLQIVVASTATDAVHRIRVRAVAGTEERIQEVKVLVTTPRIRLVPVGDVTMEPGESRALAVQIERHSVQSAVVVTLDGLPTGVQAAPARIKEGDDRGEIRLKAAPDAAASCTVVLRAVAGDVRAERELTLIVRKAPKLEKVIKNSLGMQMVLIPKGKFTMGSPRDEAGRFENEEDAHEVEITRPFYLGKYEVTRGEFAAFVKATGYRTEAEKDGKGGWGLDSKRSWLQKPEFTWRKTSWEQTDQHPVVNVSWNDAVAFCDWLSKKEGKKYRLPTEAEWEYACRAGTKTRFYSGDDAESLATAGNVADASAKDKLPRGSPTAFTAPVGKLKANAFGLYDMHGNAWEWCQDWHSNDYYKHSPPQDPQGPSSGTERVIRGGSFYEVARFCRAANRRENAPSSRFGNIGFRVACVP